jgi:hypothetical protein
VRIVILAAVIFTPCGGVLADWDVGDPCLYSQLPDTAGWDVYSEWQYGAADDWTATSTALITDIHFWGSWKYDVVGDMGNLLIQIFDNDTSNPSFPKPGNQLWEYVAAEGTYTTKKFDNIGWQGWYDPRGPYDEWGEAHNHQDMYQYNIILNNLPEEERFEQVEGQTYWLQISSNYEGCLWGWKTTTQPSGATAVFWDKWGYWGWNWQQLYEPLKWCQEECYPPREPLPLGMAFVITPEPATLLLLAAGAAVVLRKRKM